MIQMLTKCLHRKFVLLLNLFLAAKSVAVSGFIVLEVSGFIVLDQYRICILFYVCNEENKKVLPVLLFREEGRNVLHQSFVMASKLLFMQIFVKAFDLENYLMLMMMMKMMIMIMMISKVSKVK